MDGKELIELKWFSSQIRIETMNQFKARGFGHIGGSLSIVEILAVLYGKVMKYDPKNPNWEGRDYLVLSKGHAGPSLYSALALKGFFPKEWLGTLNQPHTHIPSHCDKNLTPGIDMTTGSLGQGLSVAAGIALALKMSHKTNKVFVILGDGECDEGQIWEAALFASQHKLNNLVVFVDNNKKQLDGDLEWIISLGDIGAKFNEFGFFVQSIKGNDIEAIVKAIEISEDESLKPSLIVLDTIKGAGIKLVEDLPANHHLTIDGDFADRCILELNEQLKMLNGGENLC